VVTGPNHGADDVRPAFGQAHYLAKLGSRAGKEAKLFLFDRMFTAF